MRVLKTTKIYRAPRKREREEKNPLTGCERDLNLRMMIFPPHYDRAILLRNRTNCVAKTNQGILVITTGVTVFLSLNICKIFSHLFDELGVPPVVGVPRCHPYLCDVERLELALHEGGGGVRVAPAVLAGAEAVLKVPD